MFGGGRRYGAQPRDPFEDMMDHVFGGSFFGPPFQQQFGGGGIFDDLSRSGTSFGMDPFFADPFFRPPFLQQQQQQYQQRSAPPQVGCTNAGGLTNCVKIATWPWRHSLKLALQTDDQPWFETQRPTPCSRGGRARP